MNDGDKDISVQDEQNAGESLGKNLFQGDKVVTNNLSETNTLVNVTWLLIWGLNFLGSAVVAFGTVFFIVAIFVLFEWAGTGGTGSEFAPLMLAPLITGLFIGVLIVLIPFALSLYLQIRLKKQYPLLKFKVANLISCISGLIAGSILYLLYSYL